MKYLRSLISTFCLLITASAVYGAGPMVVDVFIDMNGTSVGSQTSPSTMAAGTKGTRLTWRVNDGVQAMTVGPQRMTLPAPIQVGSTTYPVNYAHQSLKYDTSYSFNTYRASLPTDERILTASGYITFGIPNQGDSGSLSDLVRIHLTAGAGSVMQLYNGNGPGYVLNIEAYGNNTTHSSKIPVSPGATYWYTYKVDYVQGRAYLNVYDTPGFNLKGSVTHNTPTGEIEYVQYGNGEDARAGSAGSNFNYFEASVLDYSRAVFPLVPDAGGTPPAPSCDVNNDGATNVADVQLGVNQVLGVAACTADVNQDGQCTVVDVQRIVNAALGGGCSVI